jgi:hypothetical protein
MSAKKLTGAFEKTVVALLPLSPEERRRVIEAVHSLIEIGPGQRQNADAGARAPGRKPARRAARPRGRG